MYRNEWTIAGFLGNNPIARTPKGYNIAEMSVAVSIRNPKTGDQSTTWYKVSFFGPDSLVAVSSLKKGDNVLVVGKPKVNTYTNKDGQEVSELVMEARRVTKVRDIRAKKAQPAQPEPAPEPTFEPPSPDLTQNDDDLPF